MGIKHEASLLKSHVQDIMAEGSKFVLGPVLH